MKESERIRQMCSSPIRATAPAVTELEDLVGILMSVWLKSCLHRGAWDMSFDHPLHDVPHLKHYEVVLLGIHQVLLCLYNHLVPDQTHAY